MLHSYYYIRPYQSNGFWFFDDPKVGLLKEGLTDGVPDVLTAACLKNGIEPQNFLLKFSKFENLKYHLVFSHPLRDGNAFKWLEGNMMCWFCPALFRYFKELPELIRFDVNQIHSDGLLVASSLE